MPGLTHHHHASPPRITTGFAQHLLPSRERLPPPLLAPPSLPFGSHRLAGWCRQARPPPILPFSIFQFPKPVFWLRVNSSPTWDRHLTPKSHGAAGCVIGQKSQPRPQGRGRAGSLAQWPSRFSMARVAERVLRLNGGTEVMPAILFAANEGMPPVGGCLIIRPRVGGV